MERNSKRGIGPLCGAILATLVILSATLFIQTSEVAEADDSGLCRVIFDPNGGEGTPVSWSVLQGNSVDLPTDTYLKSGSYLAGWSTSPSGTGSFGSVTINSDVTYYAIWASLPSGTYEFHDEEAPTEATMGTIYTYSAVKDGGRHIATVIFGERGIYDSSGVKVDSMPAWMSWSIDSHRITFTGNPDKAGNYLIMVHAYDSMRHVHLDGKMWWIVHVPSASDVRNSLTFTAGEGEGGYATEAGPAGTGTVLPSSGFTRDGYTLAAFSTVERGTTVYYPLSSIYTFKGEDAVMTAYYVPDTGIVVFDAAGGVSAAGTQAYVVQTDGVVTTPSSGYSKAGHVLVGWRLSSDPSGPVYAPGYAYRMSSVSGTVTMTAVWVPQSETLCKVVFASNGGMGASGGSVSVPSGYRVATPMVGYTMPGYVLSGWNTAADGSGTHYAPGAAVDVTGPAIIYAEWTQSEPASDHSVVFVMNGGTGSAPTQYVADGSSALKPSDPSLDRYAFLGWQRVGDKVVWDFSSPVTSDMVLRAMWQKMYDVYVSGQDVTVKLAPGFLGQPSSVDWGDGSTDVLTVEATHRYAQDGAGTLVVTCAGYSASSHYTVSSSSSGDGGEGGEGEERGTALAWLTANWMIVAAVMAALFIAVVRFI